MTLADGVVRAAGNTAEVVHVWGIPGPLFLGFYVVAAILTTVHGLTRRIKIVHATSAAPIGPDALTLTETAMLFNDRRPVLAAVALLRGRELIDSSGSALRSPSPEEEASLEAVGRSLLTYLFSRGRRHLIALGGAAHLHVQRLRDTLIRRGYMIGPKQRRAFWVASLPMWAVLLLGCARIAAEASADQPYGWLVFFSIVLLICISRVLRTQRLTQRGRLAADEALRTHSHLAPAHRPAYAAYGPDSAALGVALFGPDVLRLVDPRLARTIGTLDTAGGVGGASGSRRPRGGTGGGYTGGSSCGSGGVSCGSSSSSCGSSSSSCGGGSSCSSSSCSSSSSSCSSSSSSCGSS
ncbi:TIGR04222 domain-containing membrane protein [Nocardia jejuensis]|uniref:TIGR04222 domain-containing membrane protein n=1 Tax=Nocardia jejuensis TaxID=328049 RepID=UPI00083058F7|nr:TIGR04222 domain-containing membrane protein [Nocardia jejuensis]